MTALHPIRVEVIDEATAAMFRAMTPAHMDQVDFLRRSVELLEG